MEEYSRERIDTSWHLSLEAIEQIFFVEYFYCQTWHFCPRLAKFVKMRTVMCFFLAWHFLYFCRSNLRLVFFGVGGGRAAGAVKAQKTRNGNVIAQRPEATI